jgi:hypothetical protein
MNYRRLTKEVRGKRREEKKGKVSVPQTGSYNIIIQILAE